MINLRPVNTKFLFLGTATSLILVIAGLVLNSWYRSKLSYQSLTRLEIKSAARHAQSAKKTVGILNSLTLSQIPDLIIWQKSLDSVSQAERITSSIEPKNLFKEKSQPIFTAESKQALTALNKNLSVIGQKLSQSWFYPRLKQKDNLSHYLNSAQSLIGWAETLNQNKHQFIVWLQNSDEIRATGGFVGSVAVLEIKNNYLQEPFFLDIYDLAGQTTPVKPAPAGIKQYLSGGQGMSITDANWHPDFAQAAHTWFSFLPKTKQPNLPISQDQIELMIAINLNLITNLLEITGPTYLPDYDLKVTADNLSTVAREKRDQFFAGDQQKKQFLEALLIQLKFRLQQLDSNQLEQLQQLILTQYENGEIKLYSPLPKVQSLISTFSLRRQAQTEEQHLLHLIESNVGINKANSDVSRQVRLEIKPNLINIYLTFANQNKPLSDQKKQKIKQNPDLLQADHLAYINYQRLITDPSFKLLKATCNEQEVEADTGQITDSFGQDWLQIGFLSTTAEQSTSYCQLTLEPKYQLDSDQPWLIIKQPGLKPVPYQIDWFSQKEQLELNQDLLLNL